MSVITCCPHNCSEWHIFFATNYRSNPMRFCQLIWPHVFSLSFKIESAIWRQKGHIYRSNYLKICLCYYYSLRHISKCACSKTYIPYVLIWLRIMSITIHVPVLPIPALKNKTNHLFVKYSVKYDT